MSASEIRKSYPPYFMSKNKVQLSATQDPDLILRAMKAKYEKYDPIDVDGVKIDFEDSWVHMRKSNTEPIVRIYTEAMTEGAAEELAQRFLTELAEL